MSRVLILIAALIVFRVSLVRRRRRSFTELSPYMNSLDGLVSPCQLSAVLEETHKFKATSPPGRAAS